MRPTKGKGERFLGCDYYEDCLSRAALENWPSWNCESCDLFKTLFPGGKSKVSEEDKKSENPRMCKECGIRPTIQPNSPYCSVCLALKAKEARARKKEAIDKTPKGTKSNQEDSAALKTAKRPTQRIRQPEIVNPGRNMSFIFQGKHAYLLKEIERLAEEEVRTIDEQIIYILKSYLSK